MSLASFGLHRGQLFFQFFILQRDLVQVRLATLPNQGLAVGLLSAAPAGIWKAEDLSSRRQAAGL